jgi:hypothetical protein
MFRRIDGCGLSGLRLIGLVGLISRFGRLGCAARRNAIRGRIVLCRVRFSPCQYMSKRRISTILL